MAKFHSPSKLPKEEVNKLIIRFFKAISLLKNPNEAAEFLKDLISPQEAEMLAKRLKIAELLIAGNSYTDISFGIKVSSGTIARVHEWLKLSGGGYRLVLERIPKEESGDSFEEKFDPFSWRNIKKRYPMYYWPQIVLENIVKTAKGREKQKLEAVIKEMDKKSALYKKLNKILHPAKDKKRF